MNKLLLVLGLLAFVSVAYTQETTGEEKPAEIEKPKEENATPTQEDAPALATSDVEPEAENIREKEQEEKKEEEEAEEEEEDGHPHGRCEICVYVLTRKIRDEGTMCSKLSGIYHETCKKVLEALVRWDQNVVHWLYQRGCNHIKTDQTEHLVRPCPPHAVCAWITHNERAFCEEDLFYRQ